jgi:hypothetical protein
MQRLIGWFALLFICYACSSNGNDGGNSDQDSVGSDGDTASDTTPADDSAGDLWAPAWSIFGSHCGSANSCHNTASGGEAGLNLPSNDEAAAKTNATAKKDLIRSEVSSGRMPEDSPLTQAEKLMVTDWIDSL